MAISAQSASTSGAMGDSGRGATPSAPKRTRARRPPPCDPVVISDPPESAKAAGLRYVSDATPGITRRRAGRSFGYRGPDGGPVRGKEELARIRALAIPPAWTEVWICPARNGHLQATGRDARGRKQYRYHARWREVRDESKYNRLITFGRALPAVRARVDADLALPGLPREKVLAAVIRLMETTLIRVGNDEYARSNQSYGLTTMLDDHVEVGAGAVRFTFRGKSGKDHEIGLRDRRLARIVRRCRDLPGQTLFQFLDREGAAHTIGSSDVNAYLRELSGEDFTAKDFRTWHGTTLAAQELAAGERPETEAEAKRLVNATIVDVAARLGNTPTICRTCYVHPGVLAAFHDGNLAAHADVIASSPTEAALGLTAGDRLVLRLLETEAGG